MKKLTPSRRGQHGLDPLTLRQWRQLVAAVALAVTMNYLVAFLGLWLVLVAFNGEPSLGQLALGALGVVTLSTLTHVDRPRSRRGSQEG